MKMFDMTQQDIEDLINHNKTLKQLCCNYNIQCTGYDGPLYKSVDIASRFLKEYLDMLKKQYYDKYKDTNEQDAAMIFISIIARILAFYTYCWKMLENIKNKDNDFLFNHDSCKVMLSFLHYPINSWTMVCRIVDEMISWKEVDIEIVLKENKELLKNIKIVSSNVKNQIKYILDNETVGFCLNWRREYTGGYGTPDEVVHYNDVLLNTIKETILNKINQRL